jgi:hypothetical protein
MLVAAENIDPSEALSLIRRSTPVTDVPTERGERYKEQLTLAKKISQARVSYIGVVEHPSDSEDELAPVEEENETAGVYAATAGQPARRGYTKKGEGTAA